ncbi:MAG: DUF192 domain-containing protein [Bacteroidota bacterium]
MKGLRFYWIVAFLTGILLLSCKEKATSGIATEKIDFTKEGELQILQQDSVIAFLNIEIADSDYEVQTGLMYRESMRENEGMLFVFPDVAVHSFYMKNTQFPLDLLFIDPSLKVASITENAQPLDETSLSSQVPIKYVLEINAGLTQKWNIKVGDSIAYNKID